MVRKFFCALGVAAVMLCATACRPSENNAELEPSVQKIEQVADQLSQGQMSLPALLEAQTELEKLQKDEDKLSSSQYDRLKKAAEKMEKAVK